MIIFSANEVLTMTEIEDLQSSEGNTLRQSNIKLFRTMLAHLGQAEFKLATDMLAEDVYCDWPYIPAPGLAESITGRQQVHDFFAGGMSDFEPYKYTITEIYELIEPNTLIAEYFSDSKHLKTGKPYGNKYVAIVRFSDGEICYWREYVNPLPIHEALRATGAL